MENRVSQEDLHTFPRHLPARFLLLLPAHGWSMPDTTQLLHPCKARSRGVPEPLLWAAALSDGSSGGAAHSSLALDVSFLAFLDPITPSLSPVGAP